MVPVLTDWFERHGRALPWRETSPWGVLVSEFMLQQTPVDRVLPVWHAWMVRWPTPGDLAVASVADAIRAWDRLGYPRRALRLHQSAVIISRDHSGRVPHGAEALRTLPGVGEYTAAAVEAFAFSRRSIVLDTNVRRVLLRVLAGTSAPTSSIGVAERQRAEGVWPTGHRRSALWSAAVMEFGAVVCTARRPDCAQCPIRSDCAWTAEGQPVPAGPARRQAEYAGSDRQARGRILEVLRQTSGSVPVSAIDGSWPDAAQAERALASLVADGLVLARPRRRYSLPDG